MTASHVRPARASDAEAAARAQLAAWRADRELPRQVLDLLDPQELAAQWAAAAVSPPSPRHRVLVAVDGTDGIDPPGAGSDGLVVGIVATAPATDPDRSPDTDAEVLALAVHPDHRRKGHGSRLLQAAADTLSAAGFTTATAWVENHDDVGRRFLTDAGWMADGAHRTLDLDGNGDVTVSEIRLTTQLPGEE